MTLLQKVSSLLILSILCFACTQKPAQVVTNSKNLYNKNNSLTKKKYQNLPQSKTSKALQVEVAAGDTLYSISKKYQVPLRDLITENNLTPPYGLVLGSKLNIPASVYYEVKKGETIYQIARNNNTNINSLVALNDLKEPYRLQAGQKIKIAAPDNRTSVNLVQNKTEYKSETKTTETAKTVIATKENVTPNKEGTKTYSPNFVEKTLDKFNHFAWPLKGEVISKFGPKKGGLYNDGINIKALEGSKVKASEDGVVAYVGNELKGYGNLIIIKHSGGWITAYAHLSKTLVKRGQKVAKGDQIAEVGSTGNVNSPQLYFGLRKGRDSVNPANYLSK